MRAEAAKKAAPGCRQSIEPAFCSAFSVVQTEPRLLKELRISAPKARTARLFAFPTASTSSPDAENRLYNSCTSAQSAPRAGTHALFAFPAVSTSSPDAENRLYNSRTSAQSAPRVKAHALFAFPAVSTSSPDAENQFYNSRTSAQNSSYSIRLFNTLTSAFGARRSGSFRRRSSFFRFSALFSPPESPVS